MIKNLSGFLTVILVIVFAWGSLAGVASASSGSSDPDDSYTCQCGGNDKGYVLKRVIYYDSNWSQGDWAQTDYEFYLEPKLAREFADKYRPSTLESAAGLLAGLIPTVGPMIAIVSWMNSTYDANFASQIADQSELGPVKFTIVDSRYATLYGQVEYWNGSGASIDYSDHANSYVASFQALH